jgi:hypothetical protein
VPSASVSNVKNQACCVLFLRVPGPYLGAITALNFSKEPLQEQIEIEPLLERDERFQSAGGAVDILTGKRLPSSQERRLGIDLSGHSYKTLIIERASD